MQATVGNLKKVWSSHVGFPSLLNFLGRWLNCRFIAVDSAVDQTFRKFIGLGPIRIRRILFTL